MSLRISFILCKVMILRKKTWRNEPCNFFFFNELSQWLLTGKKLSIFRDLRARETKIGL